MKGDWPAGNSMLDSCTAGSSCTLWVLGNVGIKSKEGVVFAASAELAPLITFQYDLLFVY